jgi:urease accessory protein
MSRSPHPATSGAAGATGTDPLATLRLLQLSDSQFPVGAFAHSNGLEAYAADGLEADGLERLLRSELELGWGRLDVAAWALAWRTPELADLRELGEELSAWKPVPGLRETSLRLGLRTLRLATRLWEGLDDLAELEAPHQALVAGAIARRLSIPRREGALAYAHTGLLAALAAATRCMPLSPERAQEIAVALHPAVAAAADRALREPRAHLWSATPGVDLAAHRQRFLRTRLFQS